MILIENYIWLFPILFILHDFEEIIGLGIWYQKSKEKLKIRFPKISRTYEKMYANYSTEGMALAVYEELIICVFVCGISYYFNFYMLWIGVFIGFILHMMIHILQAIIWLGYIPALATSIIITPISIVVLIKSIQTVEVTFGEIILWCLIGSIIIVSNLKFSHFLMNKFSISIKKYSNN